MAHDQDPVYNLLAGVLFPVVCCLTVALRFFTRRTLRVRYGFDDWLLLPALAMVTGCGACLVVGVAMKTLAYPTPPPSDPSDPSDSRSLNFTVVEQLEWAFFLMQIVAMGLTKLSFVFFYRRIFLGNDRKGLFGMVTIGAIVALLLWCIAFFLWFLLSCASNFRARWTTVAELHSFCPSDLKSDVALAISDVVTDLMVILLPLPMVLKLRMPAKQKLLVLAIFALGSIAVAASLVRLVLFIQIAELAAGIIQDPSADNNLLATRALYWSMLESGLALIACCLPTLYALSKNPRVQSAIRSTHRFVSHVSQRSQRGFSSKPLSRSAATSGGGKSSISSAGPIIREDPTATHESFTMVDTIVGSRDSCERQEGEIWVERTVDLRPSLA